MENNVNGISGARCSEAPWENRRFAVKKEYERPSIMITPMQMERYFCAGSTASDGYSIGGSGSPNEKSGDISNGGPGVAGSKSGIGWNLEEEDPGAYF